MSFVYACGGGGNGTSQSDASPRADAAPTIDALSDDVAVAFCNDFAVLLCGKLYTCLTAEERTEAGLPATEAECVTTFQQEECAETTLADICEPPEAFHPDQTGPCLEQFEALTCEQFSDFDFDETTDAPACAAVCQ